jgi:hypothetical protein
MDAEAQRFGYAEAASMLAAWGFFCAQAGQHRRSRCLLQGFVCCVSTTNHSATSDPHAPALGVYK